MQEIYDQEKHIAQLKKAIRDKEAPLKVYQLYSTLIFNLGMNHFSNSSSIGFSTIFVSLGVTNSFGSKNSPS